MNVEDWRQEVEEAEKEVEFIQMKMEFLEKKVLAAGDSAEEKVPKAIKRIKVSVTH